MTRESSIAEISVSQDGCRYHFSLSTHRLIVSEYLIQKRLLGLGSPHEIPVGYCAFPLRAISEIAFHIDKDYSGCHLDVTAGNERKEWHIASRDRSLIVRLMNFAEALSARASGVPQTTDEDEGVASPPSSQEQEAGRDESEAKAKDNDSDSEAASNPGGTPPAEILVLATRMLESAHNEFPELGIAEMWIAASASAKDNGHWAGYLVANGICGSEHTHLVRDEVVQALNGSASANGLVFAPEVVGPTFRYTLANSGAYRVGLDTDAAPSPPDNDVSDDRGSEG